MAEIAIDTKQDQNSHTATNQSQPLHHDTNSETITPTPIHQVPYRGLLNIGATCYMNSLLQTLFLTPQFREGIFRWRHDPIRHPRTDKSILYQLQVLFAKLQTGFPGELTTAELTKSFQWDDGEAHMQQDVQEFNRVLMQAIEASFGNQKETAFLRQLYEGLLSNYTRCRECGYQSERQQVFQQLLLQVRTPFGFGVPPIYNPSVDVALQRSMKPEQLDENNLYFCEACNKKVRAERGLRYLRLPKVLPIVLQRFQYDFETGMRYKLHDRVEYPSVLNFNRYMQGYEGIPDKLPQDAKPDPILQAQQPYIARPKPTRTVIKAKPVVSSKVAVGMKAGSAGQGAKSTKPSSSTKQFLLEMKKKKNAVKQPSETQIYCSGDPLKTSNAQSVGVSDGAQNNTTVANNPTLQQPPTEKVQNPSKPTINVRQTSASETYYDEVIENSVQGSSINTQSRSSTSIKVQAGNQTDQIIVNSSVGHSSSSPKQPIPLPAALTQKLNSSFQDGPSTYTLFAILLHSGSANHGHYHCLIRSYETKRWYDFNDGRVNEVGEKDVQAGWGGNGKESAYAAYYRLVEKKGYEEEEQEDVQLSISSGNNIVRMANQSQIEQHRLFNLLGSYPTDLPLPAYITTHLQAQLIAYLSAQANNHTGSSANAAISPNMPLKISFGLQTKSMVIPKATFLKDCVVRALQLYGLKKDVQQYQRYWQERESDKFNDKDSNVSLQALKQPFVRLRLYNPCTDTRLQTLNGYDLAPLSQIGLLKPHINLLIQFRQANECFEEYEPNRVTLYLAYLQQNPNVNGLTRDSLISERVTVEKGATIVDVMQMVTVMANPVIPSSSIQYALFKLHKNDSYTYHEELHTQLTKTLDELTIINGEVLYAEQIENGQQSISQPLNQANATNSPTVTYKWPIQFQLDIHRIQIKCVYGSRDSVGVLMAGISVRGRGIYANIERSKLYNASEEQKDAKTDQKDLKNVKDQNNSTNKEQSQNVPNKVQPKPQSTTIILTVDSRLPLSNLKQLICNHFNINPLTTILRRCSAHGQQLKDLQATLIDSKFVTGTTVWIQEGVVARKGEVRVGVWVVTKIGEEEKLGNDSSRQNGSQNSFEYIGEIPIDTTLKPQQVKDLLRPVVQAKLQDIN